MVPATADQYTSMDRGHGFSRRSLYRPVRRLGAPQPTYSPNNRQRLRHLRHERKGSRPSIGRTFIGRPPVLLLPFETVWVYRELRTDLLAERRVPRRHSRADQESSSNTSGSTATYFWDANVPGPVGAVEYARYNQAYGKRRGIRSKQPRAFLGVLYFPSPEFDSWERRENARTSADNAGKTRSVEDSAL